MPAGTFPARPGFDAVIPTVRGWQVNCGGVAVVSMATGRKTDSSVVNAVPVCVRPDERVAKDDGKIDCTRHAVRVIEALGIDALVAIGGDDTLSFANRLHHENVSVVAIPKTMDNDVVGTDYCIGFSTAVTRSVEMITNFRSAVGSHERIGVVELFGRHSGATSFYAAYLAAADRAIIPEVPFDIERLAALLTADRDRNPSNYAIMTISEAKRTPSDTRSSAASATPWPRSSSV